MIFVIVATLSVQAAPEATPQDVLESLAELGARLRETFAGEHVGALRVEDVDVLAPLER